MGMSVRKRAAGLVTGFVTVAALAIPLTPGTAYADLWWKDPGTCTNHKTATQRIVARRIVEIRYGDCRGRQHGWARLRGFDSDAPDYIRFEVDLNGDRSPDTHSVRRARDRNYTAGYPTSRDSRRAFRACFVRSRSEKCNSRNATRWW